LRETAQGLDEQLVPASQKRQSAAGDALNPCLVERGKSRMSASGLIGACTSGAAPFDLLSMKKVVEIHRRVLLRWDSLLSAHMSPGCFPANPRDVHQHRLGAVFGSFFQDVDPGVGPAHKGGHLLELLGLSCKHQRIRSVGNESPVHEFTLGCAEAARVIWITSGRGRLHNSGPKPAP
jgi:hypothetical protein